MLNISPNKVTGRIDSNKYKTFKKLETTDINYTTKKVIFGFLILVLVFMFVPWTQNVHGSGFVTTLSPEERPQTIHTAIAGRIEKWYVNEGDYVQKGDTIYTYTDGYADQFGGENGKKYTYKRLRGKLLAISQEQLAEQKMSLENEFENWRNKEEQIDDICLIGVSI